MGEGLRGQRGQRGWRMPLQLLYAFIIITVFSMVTGCNLKEKINSSITDEIPEEELLTEYMWPTGEAAKHLPELEEGVITYVSEEPASCEIIIVEISSDVYEEYLIDLQDFDYTFLLYESDTEGYENVTGSTPDGADLSLTYQEDERSLKLNVELTDTRE